MSVLGQPPNTRRRQENDGTCASCGQALAGFTPMPRSAAHQVPDGRSAIPGNRIRPRQPRACKQCGESIDHLNAKAKFCSKDCTSAVAREQDREGYNAKAARGSRPRRARRTAAPTSRRTPSAAAVGAEESAEVTRSGTRGTGSSGPAANAEAVAEIGRMRGPARRATRTASGSPSGVAEDRQPVPGVLRLLRREGRRSSTWITWCRSPRADGMPQPTCLPACGRCNLTKHAMFLSVWRYRGRRLGAERLINQ
jgi:hypothetical protein